MQNVNNPEHYQGASPIGRRILLKTIAISAFELRGECIEYLEANPRYSDFHMGNAIKYIWRAGAKGDAAEDLNKAIWYLDRRLQPQRRNFNFFFHSAFGGDRSSVDALTIKLINAIQLKIKGLGHNATLLP